MITALMMIVLNIIVSAGVSSAVVYASVPEAKTPLCVLVMQEFEAVDVDSREFGFVLVNKNRVVMLVVPVDAKVPQVKGMEPIENPAPQTCRHRGELMKAYILERVKI